MKKNTLKRIGIMALALGLIYFSLNIMPAQAANWSGFEGASVQETNFSVISVITITSSSITSSTTTEETTGPKDYPKAMAPGVNYKGNCVGNLFGHPGSGAQLWNQSKPGLGVSCEVKYTEGSGPFSGWVYVKLNAFTRNAYDKMDLNLKLQNSSGGWENCPYPVLFENGEYGMIGCYASAVTSWGLGK